MGIQALLVAAAFRFRHRTREDVYADVYAGNGGEVGNGGSEKVIFDRKALSGDPSETVRISALRVRLGIFPSRRLRIEGVSVRDELLSDGGSRAELCRNGRRRAGKCGGYGTFKFDDLRFQYSAHDFAYFFPVIGATKIRSRCFSVSYYGISKKFKNFFKNKRKFEIFIE